MWHQCCCFSNCLAVVPVLLTPCTSALQGITNIAVQSSVSLQHLPVDKCIEKGLPSELLGRLSFASQKLDEVWFLPFLPADVCFPFAGQH